MVTGMVTGMLRLLQFMVIMECTMWSLEILLTYEHRDQASGRALTCKRCPPGMHMVRHCSATEQTQCAHCPPQHYTQQWNYLQRCLFCTRTCEDNQVVLEACSALQNTVCQCKPGYFMQEDFCRPHTECRPGYGVKVKGTAEADTVCEQCAKGSYSPSGRSKAPCRSHTDCRSLRLRTVLEGARWHDSLCASCDDLRAHGGLELLRGILPDFFSYHKMSAKKLERFVIQSLYPGSTVHLRQHGSVRKESLRNHINTWIKEAVKEKLRKLPQMLWRCDLYHAAQKLEKILSKVTNVTICDHSMD